jgi:integrase
VALASERIDSHDIADCTKVVGPVRSGTEAQLWEAVESYLPTVDRESSRFTEFGYFKGVTKLLKLQPPTSFSTAFDKLSIKQKSERAYKEMDVKELVEKLGCTDGTSYFTTEKAQQLVKKHLDTDTDKGLYQYMLLSLFAFHGNRPQDWMVRYMNDGLVYTQTSDEMAGERGYYSAERNTLHLFKGKTQKKGTERVVKVDPIVGKTIARYHASIDYASPYLTPKQRQLGECAEEGAVRKCIQATFFCHTNRYGFPGGINLTDLRHLYESHIRHHLKLGEETIEEKMREIGHSNRTSLQFYSELYKNIYNNTNTITQ